MRYSTLTTFTMRVAGTVETFHTANYTAKLVTLLAIPTERISVDVAPGNYSAVAFVRTQCSLVPTALTLPKDGAWYRGLRAPTPQAAAHKSLACPREAPCCAGQAR